MRRLKTKLSDLKKWFKNCSLKKKVWLSGGIFFALALFYFLVAFLAVNPTEVQLAKLKNSWEKEKICHENCALKRRAMTDAIIENLGNENKGTESRLRRRLKFYILNEQLSAEFRTELVRILRRADGPDNPPDYLKDYLALNVGEAAIQGEIINSFSAASLASGSAERSPLDYYFALLTGDRNLDIKQAAVFALSNYSDKTRYFSSDQLIIIKNLVLDPTTDRHLRQSLILLLDDYYTLFPTITADTLTAVYKTKTFNDNISRAFAADILNKKNGAGKKWPLPIVSDAAWDEYYNN